MDLTFRPLTAPLPGWKPAHANRPYSPFSATASATRSLLTGELRHIGARTAHLQVLLTDPVRGVRNDGQLRAKAQAAHPGVALTIDTRSHGTLVYDTDAYQGGRGLQGWEVNLRAIALGLHDLRRLERYGIAKRGQQYAGFAELGSGMAMSSGMTAERAAELLAVEACRGFGDDWVTADALLEDPEGLVKGAYRDAVRLHHPDVGGDPEMFRLLTEARDLLQGGRP
jgi:hypothetical protein